MLDLIGDSLDLRRKLTEIHAGDVEAMHRQITESRGPVRANRVLAIASKAFSLSLKPLPGETKPWRDAAAGNPCKVSSAILKKAGNAFLGSGDRGTERCAGRAHDRLRSRLHQVHHVHRLPAWRGHAGDVVPNGYRARILGEALGSYEAEKGSQGAAEPAGSGTAGKAS